MTATSDPSSSPQSVRWTIPAICIGLSGMAALAVIETALSRIKPGYALLPAPLQMAVYVALVGMVATAVVVRRLDSGEQRLAQLIDVRYAEGYTDGMTGRPAASVMHLTRGEKARS